MAEATQFTFSYREVVELLVKKQGLHEGFWALTVNFGMQATNVGANESDLKPAAIVAVLGIGLMRAEKETALAFDAAKINPKSKSTRS